MNLDFADFDFSDPHLRVFPKERPVLDHQDIPFFGALPELLQSLRNVTKREILFVRAGAAVPSPEIFSCPVRMDNEKVVGHLVLAPKKTKRRSQNDELAEQLLRSLADFLADTYRWPYVLRDREESAAAQVPLPQLFRSEERFGRTLRELLKTATQLLEGSAAALYLLDETTRTLNLRSIWGLPEERLLDGPRPLNGSMADLEAMLGHAVVLNNTFALESWGTPELFPTCVCIPVASESTIFGTAWFYCDEERDFDSREMGYMEMSASRLAAELERRAVVNELHRLREGLHKTVG